MPPDGSVEMSSDENAGGKKGLEVWVGGCCRDLSDGARRACGTDRWTWTLRTPFGRRDIVELNRWLRVVW